MSSFYSFYTQDTYKISTFNEDQELNEILTKLNKIELNLGDYENCIYEKCSEFKRKIQLYTENTIANIKTENSLDINTDENELSTPLQSRINELKAKSESLIGEIEKHQKECISFYNVNEANEIIQNELKPLKEKVKAIKELEVRNKFITELNCIRNKFENFKNKSTHFIFGNNLMELKLKDTNDSDEFAYYISFHQLLSLGKSINCTFKFTEKILINARQTVTTRDMVKLIDLNNGECLMAFNGPDWVDSVKLFNDNNIFSFSKNKIIKMWNITTGDCQRTFWGHSDLVTCIVALSNDRIASGSFDYTIRIWELESGDCIKILNGHFDAVTSIVNFSNERLLSASHDKTIKLWNVISGDCLKTFIGHHLSVTCVEVFSNGRILTGSHDNTIKLWNKDTVNCVKTLVGHTSWVTCIQVLSDDEIISGSADRTLKIWCLKTNDCIKTIEAHSDAVTGIQVLSNKRIASCSSDRTIKIWDLVSANCIKTFQSDNIICSIDSL